jgi:hypothetical protein
MKLDHPGWPAWISDKKPYSNAKPLKLLALLSLNGRLGSSSRPRIRQMVDRPGIVGGKHFTCAFCGFRSRQSYNLLQSAKPPVALLCVLRCNMEWGFRLGRMWLETRKCRVSKPYRS